DDSAATKGRRRRSGKAHSYRPRSGVRDAGRRAMRRCWSTASIRVRLTAWYTAVLTLMLIAYATATYIAVRHEFHEQLEQEEQREAGQATATPEERIEQQLDEILVVLVLGLPLIVVLAGAGGYVLARRALTPIGR